MWMPGSDICFEELISCVLGERLQQGRVVKIAANPHYQWYLTNASPPHSASHVYRTEVQQPWSSARPIICPGWKWYNCSLQFHPFTISGLVLYFEARSRALRAQFLCPPAFLSLTCGKSLYTPVCLLLSPWWSLLPSTVHDLQTFECATDPNQLTDNDQRKPDIFYDTVTWNINTHPRQNRHFRYGHGNDVRYEIAMCSQRPISASVNTNSHWKMTPCIVQLLQISLCVCSFKIIGQSIKLKRPEIWWCII